jgi:hypothetical protein
VPGIQDFTYANHGKETTRGTAVAPTRKFLGDATGVLDVDPELNFHEGENRGRRSTVVRVTQAGETVKLKLRQDLTFDDFVLPITQIKGGLTGTGGAADKTWAGAPSMTAANLQEAHTFDVGDDTQNYRIAYCMMRSFSLKSAKGGMTSMEADLFGQHVTKPAKATPADPAVSPKIVGDHWTIKFAGTFAGLPGASVSLNFLVDHKLTVMTGLVPERYQDGNLYFGQHVETSFGGSLEMTVESTALAISEFYDKWLAQTLDYIRLKNTSPVVLGGSFPSLQFDFAVFYEKVEVIADQRDGINLYKIKARLADDLVNPLISPTLVCSLAAIP